MPKFRWLIRYELAFAVSEKSGKPVPYVREIRELQYLDEFNTWEPVPEEIDQVSRESAELALDGARRRDA